MRLGQLARQLEISTEEAVNILSEQGIEIKDHPNVKVPEDGEAYLLSKFNKTEVLAAEVLTAKTEELEQAKEEEEIIAEVEESPIITSKDEEVLTPIDTEVNIPEVKSEVETPIEETSSQLVTPELLRSIKNSEDQLTFSELSALDENVQVIKSPKIELPGLKVLGKIELPQKKVAEEANEETVNDDETEVVEADKAPEVRIIQHDRRNSRPRLTREQLEEKRLRSKRAQERRIEEQKERAERKEKEQIRKLKERHYKAKVSTPSQQPKSKKKQADKKVAEIDQRPKPTTMIGKFWRWLNT
ncbi:MAG: hypothetical protein ACI83W_002637 [Marinoscillum sp.]|jgi:hypothetical protein